jgi:NAD(P)H-hydrate epimerase
MKLITVEEMQRAERESGVAVPTLMENAGLAVAQEAWLMLGELAEHRVLVLAGPGNNGGDGLVAARHLKDWAADVIVAVLQSRGEDDANMAALLDRAVPVIDISEEGGMGRLESALGGAELVIDALLGTGHARAIEGTLADVLDRLRQARTRRLPPRLIAVDLPTGVDADTGAVDPHTVAADETVTFQWSKAGLHLLPAAQYAGRVEVVDIGIPAALGEKLKTELMTERWARAVLPQRPLSGHKGTFGFALVIAGSVNYIGAAYLSCMGALRVGAGLVTLACARTVYPILASKLVETTFEPLDDHEGVLSAQAAGDVQRLLANRAYRSVLVGPGLGQGSYQQAFLEALAPMLAAGQLRTAILDADALNNLSRVDQWWRMFEAPTVITPHPGEMSRLTGLSVEDVQAERITVARRYASEWGVVVVLKGANTVAAAPDGRVRVSPFANPGLASAGTGDVLAGAIAGLSAQSESEPFDVACLGVYLHARAGEEIRNELGSAGMLASDLLPSLPRVISELRGEPRRASPPRVRGLADLAGLLDSEQAG